MKLAGFATMAAIVITTTLAAQHPIFEVVSVKPQNEMIPGISYSGSRFYQSAFARRLIEFAYDLTSIRIVGGPEWIHSEVWEIDARSSTPATTDEMRPMVRRLLSDRFGLVVHFETRQLPIYELRLARRDGTLGPNAKPAASGCRPIGSRSIQELRVSGERACGPGNIIVGSGFVARRFRGVKMSVLATELEKVVNRVVSDRTGIQGLMDLDLSYEHENDLPRPSLAQLARQPEAPALFTALQEQLGLKLDASTGPVEVLVIDSVARPTPN